MIDGSMYPPIAIIGELYRDPKRVAFRYDHKSALRGCCIEHLVEQHQMKALVGLESAPCPKCSSVWHKKGGRWSIPGRDADPKRSKPKAQTLQRMGAMRRNRKQASDESPATSADA